MENGSCIAAQPGTAQSLSGTVLMSFQPQGAEPQVPGCSSPSAQTLLDLRQPRDPEPLPDTPVRTSRSYLTCQGGKKPTSVLAWNIKGRPLLRGPRTCHICRTAPGLALCPQTHGHSALVIQPGEEGSCATTHPSTSPKPPQHPRLGTGTRGPLQQRGSSLEFRWLQLGGNKCQPANCMLETC